MVSVRVRKLRTLVQHKEQNVPQLFYIPLPIFRVLLGFTHEFLRSRGILILDHLVLCLLREQAIYRVSSIFFASIIPVLNNI